MPVKAYNSIGIIKRYYRLIRCAYLIITAEIPDISKDMALQMAFKAINNIIGPDCNACEGLVTLRYIIG